MGPRTASLAKKEMALRYSLDDFLAGGEKFGPFPEEEVFGPLPSIFSRGCNRILLSREWRRSLSFFFTYWDW